MSKEFLKEKDIKFVVQHMDPTHETYQKTRDALVEQTNGHKTFPWIFVDPVDTQPNENQSENVPTNGEIGKSKFIGGYTELVHAFNTESLHAIVKELGGEDLPEDDF